MPIIVLSAKAGLEDKVNVLRMGADDFIPKPFDNLEVLARVEAQLRRVKKFSAPPAQKQQLSCGDLVLDRDEFTVTAGGSPVTLTAREFEILALLMEYPKKVFTREQIYQHVWGEDYFGDDNTVNVHISNLRWVWTSSSAARDAAGRSCSPGARRRRVSGRCFGTECRWKFRFLLGCFAACSL